jgi:hypothetical protein
MIKKPFPEQKLVRKDKTTVLNEQAQDDLLQINTITQSDKQSNSKTKAVKDQVTKANVEKIKVTPAIKVKKIVANTPLKPKPVITKPVLGKQPPKSVNK